MVSPNRHLLPPFQSPHQLVILPASQHIPTDPLTEVFSERLLETQYPQQINIQTSSGGNRVTVQVKEIPPALIKITELFERAAVSETNPTEIIVEDEDPHLLANALNWEMHIQNKPEDAEKFFLSLFYPFHQPDSKQPFCNPRSLARIAETYELKGLLKELENVQCFFVINSSTKELEGEVQDVHAGSETSPGSISFPIPKIVNLEKISKPLHALKEINRENSPSTITVQDRKIPQLMLTEIYAPVLADIIQYREIQQTRSSQETSEVSFKDFVVSRHSNEYLLENIGLFFILADKYEFPGLYEEIKECIPVVYDQITVKNYQDIKDLVVRFWDPEDLPKQEEIYLTSLFNRRTFETYDLIGHIFSEVKKTTKNPAILTLVAFTELSPDITVLDLTYFGRNLTDEMLIVFLQKFPHLQELNIEGCTNLSEAGLKAIAQLPNLQKLDLSLLSPKLTDEMLVGILQCCPDIKELNISGCTQLKGKNWKSIPLLPNLQVLNLKDCTAITERKAARILERSPMLRELNIDGCDLLQDLAKAKDILENLISISLHAHSARILKRCPHLQALSLKALGMLAPRNIHTDFPELKKLDLRIQNPELIFRFLTEYPLLEELELSDLSELTLTNIPWNRLPNFEKLTSLKLRYNTLLTNEDFGSIMSHCSHILELDVEGCSKLEWLTNAPLHQLTKLNISQCYSMQESIPHILSQSTALQELNASHISHFTGISARCPQLKSADFSYCHQLSESTLALFIQNNPQLESLSLKGAAHLKNFVGPPSLKIIR